ncbi:NUDIX hydrolase [Marivibrio halodurans]|uniref:NUDIX hydrolase n=1 Tax=Marivibrio halodurans TaxID=2039722 RepID=A0A8J7S5B4_9PROT|nr:NUDIX hydrolase [Marivibrio halodurans]MBP5859079.1 NUDIX hydrolase [Marivibrio halodurans]
MPERPLIGTGVVVLKDGDAGPLVLLVKRAKPPRQGQWSLPGGRQELGETIRETARREVREETGVEIADLRLLDVIDSITPDPAAPAGPPVFHYTLIDFSARWASGDPRAGDDAAEAIWADTARLADYDLWDETARLIGVTCQRARSAPHGDTPENSRKSP